MQWIPGELPEVTQHVTPIRRLFKGGTLVVGGPSLTTTNCYPTFDLVPPRDGALN